MNRILRNSYIFMVIWYVGTFLFSIIYHQITDFSYRLNTDRNWMESIFMIITAIVAISLTIILFVRSRKRKNTVADCLVAFLLFSGLTAILQSILTIIAFNDNHYDNFWTQSVFFLLSFSLWYLNIFDIEVFSKGFDGPEKKKNIRRLGIISGLLIIFCSYCFKDTLFSSKKIEIIIFGLIYLITALMVYPSLFMNAFKLSKLIDGPLYKKSFKIIGWSGVALIIAFLMIFVYVIIGRSMLILNTIAYGIFSIGYIGIYIGFTLPIQEKNKDLP